MEGGSAQEMHLNEALRKAHGRTGGGGWGENTGPGREEEKHGFKATSSFGWQMLNKPLGH